MSRFKESELIISPEGAIYHLNVRPGEVAANIIAVGDPGRVPKISRYFDRINVKSQNREMVVHTGEFNGKGITVLSTGMGTDNIDIVMNELDALVNIDFNTREIKDKLTSLNIVRLGTSGAVQPEIPINSFALSTYGCGLDGLLKFYNSDHVTNKEMSDAFIEQVGWDPELPYPYFVSCSEELKNKLNNGFHCGITATAPGFYGPQGRLLRIPLRHPDLNDKMQQFRYKGEKIINFEMETSALYGLGKLLGHNTLTVCAIIANRPLNSFSDDHQKPIDELIRLVLERLTN